MRSLAELASLFQRIVKTLAPPSDEDISAAYVAEARDRIDLEMRMRDVDRGRLHGLGL